MQPGERIVETEIARSLGISQVPVREALRGLEEEGLVRSVKYKGAYVADMVLDEIFHAFVLRTQVETNVLELVVPKLTQAHFSELEAVVDEMRRVVDDANYVIQSGLDVRFHSRIIEWSGIDIYLRIWRVLNGHVRRFVTLMHPTYFSENHDAVVGQHEGLIAVLRQKDVELAKRTFADHIMFLWERYQLHRSKE